MRRLDIDRQRQHGGMHSIVKASDAQDFLAFVPRLVSFRPERSLVLVAFRGNRTCGTLRLDLPQSGARAVHKRIANTLIGMVCKIRGADAVVPVIYTDESVETRGTLPHDELVRKLIDRAELGGFAVRDALCVAVDGWGSYLDAELPEHGHPLSLIAESSVADRLPPSALTALSTPDDLARLPTVNLAETESVARAMKQLRRLLDFSVEVGDEETATLPLSLAAALDELEDEAGPLFDPVNLAEQALGWNPETLDAVRAAVMIFVLQGPPNRDATMLQFAFGAGVGAAAERSNREHADIQRATGKSMDDIVAAEIDSAQGQHPDDRLIGEMMMGQTGERPNVDRVKRAIELLKKLVALAPRSNRPAPLCMLAWLSWSLGRGSVAGRFIDDALTIDEHYGMAQLLATLLDTGMLPEWAFAMPEGGE
jgi:hypothetical protein